MVCFRLVCLYCNTEIKQRKNSFVTPKSPPIVGTGRAAHGGNVGHKSPIVGMWNMGQLLVFSGFSAGPDRAVFVLSVGRGKFAQLGAKQALGATGAKAKTQQWRVLSACA